MIVVMMQSSSVLRFCQASLGETAGGENSSYDPRRKRMQSMLHLPFNPFAKKGNNGEASDVERMPALPYVEGQDPIWHHPALHDVFCDGFLTKDASFRVGAGPGLESLVGSLGLLTRVLESPTFTQNLSMEEAISVSKVASAFEGCWEVATKMPGRSMMDKAGIALVSAEEMARRAAVAAGVSSLSSGGQLLTESAGGGRDEGLVRMIAKIVERVKQLHAGDVEIVPAGWGKSDDSRDDSDHREAHCILILIGREQGLAGTFGVSVCNLGEGSHYHPVRAQPEGGAMERAGCVHMAGVPRSKVEDGAFWYFLMRQMVYTASANGPEAIYTHLLPFLIERPITADLHEDECDFSLEALSGDASHARLAFGPALRRAFALVGVPCARTQYLSVLALAQLGDVLTRNLIEGRHGALSKPDAGLLTVVARCIDREASLLSEDSCSQQELLALGMSSENLRTAILRSVHPPFPPPPIAIDAAVGGDAVHHPMFGPLRTDGLDLEALAGREGMARILRPAELSNVANPVHTVKDALQSLRNCVHCCTILSNQSQEVRNSFCMRASLISHLFTQVLPLPLPSGVGSAHGDLGSRCFWAAQPMTHDTQSACLHSLSLIARHYAASCLSLKTTRTSDASRTVTFACIAAIADALMRVIATDVPSQASMHYSGRAPGPVSKFAFDVGDFAIESSTMCMIDPYLVTARTQVLDYFAFIHKKISPDHIIFKFDQSDEVCEGDAAFVNQICVQMGFSREDVSGPRELAGLYLTGQRSELIDVYPEIGVFRDVVFYFKLVMVPTLDDLPELKRWMPSEAALSWTCKPSTAGGVAGNVFGKKVVDSANWVVSGFGGKELRCSVRSKTEKKKKWFGLFSSGIKPRAPPSGAEPSVLAGESIETEDDVLHMNTMPDFGSRLSPSDSELLLQYLTAPYLRIPLLLSFFRDAARIHALDSIDLQGVIDAALFEPGDWQATPSKAFPELIPAPTRDHMATPCGLLFNELVMCPQQLLTCLDQMLDLALDLDTGSYHGPSTPIILYIIRLCVRAEGFAAFVLRHVEWSKDDAGGLCYGCGPAAPVRGLGVAGHEEVCLLVSLRAKLMDKLQGRAFGMLENWRMKQVHADDISSACVVIAHMGYLFSHTWGMPTGCLGGMHWKAVETLLSCQIYLTHNYGFTLEAHLDRGDQDKAARELAKKKKKEKDLKHGKKRVKGSTPIADGSLGFSQLEIFDLFQKQRHVLLTWIESGGLEGKKNAGQVLETVIRVLTSKDRLGRTEAGSDAVGGGCARVWRSLPFQGCIGRLCPDTEVVAFNTKVSEAGQGGAGGFEEWVRITTTAAVETEINIQFGTFTLKSNQAEMLGEEFTSFTTDLIDVFASQAKRRMQCAKVSETEERRWVRVMGIRHDLQLWSMDKRPPTNPFSRPNVGAPSWFNQAIAKLPSGLGPLFLEEWGSEGDSVFLRAACTVSGTVKQICVLRDPIVAHVFNVVEHGRRLFRSQIYSTDAAFSLHEMPPCLVRDDSTGKRRTYRLASGDVTQTVLPAPSLVVSRNVCSGMGRQRYIPRRMLYGTLPDCLLDDHTFWQSDRSSDGGGSMDTILGYKTEAALARDSGVPITMIAIELFNEGPADTRGMCCAPATAKVSRVPARMEGQGLLAAVLPVQEQGATPSLMLLSAAYAQNGSSLARVRDIFVSLEPLSHALFWSRDGVRVSLVELPRLRLSFKARDAGDGGGVRFYCQEHSGLYVSSHRCPNSRRLMEGLPHALLLQNTSMELFVLVSAAVKISQTCRQPELFPEFYLDRSDNEWLKNIGDVRHYLYPVHVSRMFFIMPSLAASLYLLLHRFMDRQYAAVALMAPSCVSDTSLSAEEQQLWDSLELTLFDTHPDAVACRLLVSCATAASRSYMQCAWNDGKELARYSKIRHLVSAACRLPIEDEHTLSVAQLISGNGFYSSIHVANRRALVETIRSGGDCAIPVEYPPCLAPAVGFDTVLDRTCIDIGLASSVNPAAHAAKLQGIVLANYHPPEEGTGSSQVRFLNKILSEGLTLSGLTASGVLGMSSCVCTFLLCYELLTGKLDMRLLKDDDPHQLGNLLLRMLPLHELTSKGLLMSVLRCMCLNPVAARKLPSYHAELLLAREKLKQKQEGAGRAAGMMAKLTGAVKAAFDDGSFSLEFITNICKIIAADQSAFCRWPSSMHQCYTPPELVLFDHPNRAERLLHGWEIPSVPDFACERRVIHPVSTRGVNFDAPSVSALSFLPMTPIGIKDYLANMQCAAPMPLPVHQTDSLQARASFDSKFAASSHPSSHTRNARSTVDRLAADLALYAAMSEAEIPAQLMGLQEIDVVSCLAEPSGSIAQKAVANISRLIDALTRLHAEDTKNASNAINASLSMAGDAGSTSYSALSFTLAQRCGRAPVPHFELLVGLLLCSDFEGALCGTNPFLKVEEARACGDMLSAALFSVNRAGHCARCISLSVELADILLRLRKSPACPRPQDSPLYQPLRLKASSLAESLATRRHYVQMQRGEGFGAEYDPRFLFFEFSCNLILREAQIGLVKKFVQSFRQGGSLCHQLVMGAGKTTVIAPILALMLGDPKTCVVQVVPSSLLEMTRSVMRSRFSSLVHKPVYTFVFDRADEATEELLEKIMRARLTKSVIVASPTSIKSFVIKFIEVVHLLDTHRVRTGEKAKNSQGGVNVLKGAMMGAMTGFAKFGQAAIGRLTGQRPEAITGILSSAQVEAYTKQAVVCGQILQIFKHGALLLDEVDLILHPLKSELNWPLGAKEPLDLTSAPKGLEGPGKRAGLRWLLAVHLLDAAFFCQRGTTLVDWSDNATGKRHLLAIKAALEEGRTSRMVQRTPHIVIVDPVFYLTRLRPLFARWALLWLQDKGISALSSDQMEDYITNGAAAKQETIARIKSGCNDAHIKLLNLTHDAVVNVLPHILSKINRVTYGLLSDDDLQQKRSEPISRRLLAVPFVGKDVPSPASEFSHPDIAIALTISSYRHEGLRAEDFATLLRQNVEMLAAEVGKMADRPTSVRWCEWVDLAGGRVRGAAGGEQSSQRGQKDGEKKGERKVQDTRYSPNAFCSGQGVGDRNATMERAQIDADLVTSIWPLHMVDAKDAEQTRVLFLLLKRVPQVVEWYVIHHVFPLTMRFQPQKLSASGQEVGGGLVFGRRLGFSGTPSNLLPVELGECCYERGDDGKILTTLTSPFVATLDLLPSDWTVKGVLDRVAGASPKYNALIDTGALITGFTNLEVATYLLTQGLKGFDAVVFLDSRDRKMALLRSSMAVVRMEQLGTKLEKRFTFYDQCHTTGMDIAQHFTARAAITLGKDMTFRDFAQGAYRMRGICKGQTITILAIPEVSGLVETTCALGRGGNRRQLVSGEEGLRDVASWLMVNGVRSEEVQASMLVGQCMASVWRRSAYKRLLDLAAQGCLLHGGDVPLMLQGWKEDLDLALKTSVKQGRGLREMLEGKLRQAEQMGLLNDPKDLADARRIISTMLDDGERLQEQGEMEFEAEQVQEQEQEQEQQQEQEIEMEIQKEEIRMEAAPIRRDYSRDDEAPIPFPLASLAKQPGDEQRFFPVNALTIHTRSGPVPSVGFPSYLLVSRNHTDVRRRGQHRRLKNCIIIAEWVPDSAALRGSREERPISTEMEEQLEKTFKMFDRDGSGSLDASEISHVLRALDVDIKDEVEENITAALDLDASGTVDLSELKTAMARLSFYGIQEGRYFVLLSLPEAEALRSCMHIAKSRGVTLVPGFPSASMSIRIMPTGASIDSSQDFLQGKRYQRTIAVEGARFLDSATDYTPEALVMLRTCLSSNTAEQRTRFFNEVRGARRRPQTPVEDTTVGMLLAQTGDLNLLHRRAVASRIKSLLASKGLLLGDAFAAFDLDRDGRLSPQELYAGLRWLGLPLMPAEVEALVGGFDANGDGSITIAEFKAALHVPGMDDEVIRVSSAEDLIPGLSAPSPPLLVASAAAAAHSTGNMQGDVSGHQESSGGRGGGGGGLPSPCLLPIKTAKSISCSLSKVSSSGMKQVWNSKGTLVTTGVSIWRLRTSFQKTMGSAMLGNRDERVVIGQMLQSGYGAPDTARTLEIKDRSVLRDSKYNKDVLARLLPHPKLFRLAWKLTKGSQPLFVWEAIPPDSRFVALSMTTTETEAPPSLTCIRCVPRTWCCPAAEPRRLLQENSGGLWAVSSLGFIAACKGIDAPPGPWYDVRPDLSADVFKILEADQLLVMELFKLS